MVSMDVDGLRHTLRTRSRTSEGLRASRRIESLRRVWKIIMSHRRDDEADARVEEGRSCNRSGGTCRHDRWRQRNVARTLASRARKAIHSRCASRRVIETNRARSSSDARGRSRSDMRTHDTSRRAPPRRRRSQRIPARRGRKATRSHAPWRPGRRTTRACASTSEVDTVHRLRRRHKSSATTPDEGGVVSCSCYRSSGKKMHTTRPHARRAFESCRRGLVRRPLVFPTRRRHRRPRRPRQRRRDAPMVSRARMASLGRTRPRRRVKHAVFFFVTRS